MDLSRIIVSHSDANPLTMIANNPTKRDQLAASVKMLANVTCLPTALTQHSKVISITSVPNNTLIFIDSFLL
ncbi:unnamed protein product [marine sediment metagenome]|uniref:Uncharacterized protein n=1 Tax=marine sediment metagenome TaxID=412755 RepID=X0VMK9_9ZZZZ